MLCVKIPLKNNTSLALTVVQFAKSFFISASKLKNQTLITVIYAVASTCSGNPYTFTVMKKSGSLFKLKASSSLKKQEKESYLL